MQTAPGLDHAAFRLGRRKFLHLLAGGFGATFFLLRPEVAGALAVAQPIGGGHVVRPRDSWASGLPPRGPLGEERAGDVRFLLVHHTAGSNSYRPSDVPAILRGIHRSHTAEKGWADVAYNFFVDRHGGIWEGRAGSLRGPVKGDATGGSQGFAQLCCFVGDHGTDAPTQGAQRAMVALLAWLAGRYGIDPSPGARTSFVSRGSNRWPAGRTVVTTTIAGHRDMSHTACPGDTAYQLVVSQFPGRVAATLDAVAPTPAGTGPPATPTTTPTAPPTTTTPPTTQAAVRRAGDGGGVPRVVAPAAVATGATAVGEVVAITKRRHKGATETATGRDGAPGAEGTASPGQV